MKIRLLLALSLAILARAYAAPITLELTVDTKRHATAVVSGNLGETTFPAFDVNGPKYAWTDGYYRKVSLVFAKVGTNWNVWGDLAWDIYYTAADAYAGAVYNLNLRGQHMVPADPGEATKGLEMWVYYYNVNGGSVAPPTIDTWDTFPHLAGSHVDTMSLTVPDLNGKDVPGVLSASQNFTASVELYHVPDGGSTLLWWSAGCAGVAWVSRLRRSRRD